jgi:ribosomal protein S18 acetylase RimI-like enzyme
MAAHEPRRVTFDVRPAVAEDASSVADIWQAGWREAHLGHVPPALVIARTDASFRSRARRRIDDTIVAVGDGQVLGFVMLAGAEVEQVYVAGSSRGTGVADALLARAEREIKAHGHAEAWLAVVGANARARRFYERHGWSDHGPFEHLAPSEDGPIAVPAHRYGKRL